MNKRQEKKIRRYDCVDQRQASDWVSADTLRKCQPRQGHTMCILAINFMKQQYSMLYIDAKWLPQSLRFRDARIPLWGTCPAAEQRAVEKQTRSVLSLVRNIPVEDRNAMALYSDFHIRQKNGREILVTQKFIPLSMDDCGMAMTGLFEISISGNMSFGEFVVSCGDRTWMYDQQTGRFSESTGFIVNEIEKDICRLSKNGLPVKAIAAILGRSENTIKKHKARLFKKLGVSTILSAITKMDNYSLW